jgi:hypothetical protein
MRRSTPDNHMKGEERNAITATSTIKIIHWELKS